MKPARKMMNTAGPSPEWQSDSPGRRPRSATAASTIPGTAFPRRSAGRRTRTRRGSTPLACRWVPNSSLRCPGAPRPGHEGLAGLWAGAPHVDAAEQEQPHHVDKVPVPRGELKAEVLGRLELAGHGAEQAHGQED